MSTILAIDQGKFNRIHHSVGGQFEITCLVPLSLPGRGVRGEGHFDCVHPGWFWMRPMQLIEKPLTLAHRLTPA